MSTDVMIHADSLTKMFGSFTALDRVSFDVHKGEVVGFLGPNGAGKSTTMRILTCFISPTSGTAQVYGHDVFEDPLKVREHIGYLPQRAPLYPDMTVWAYLEFTAKIRGIEREEFKKSLRHAAEICGIAQVLGKDIRNLSHGYRQRVGLAQALIHNPPILILDEPTSDLDPNEKAEVISYIREIGKERTVLLSTHNLAEVEEACARAIIISGGRVVADGALDEIRARSGRTRYTVAVKEEGLNGAAYRDNASEAVAKHLENLDHVIKVRPEPSDDKMLAFELITSEDADIRADIFQLAVKNEWVLLDLHRDAQSLGDVFHDLTKEESRRARGFHADDIDEDDDDYESDDAEDEDDDEEGDES